MKLVIVIPAFNESKVILQVLKNIPKTIAQISEIVTVVVDDGSTDDTYALALQAKTVALKHPINRGAGAATKTGILWAKQNNANIVLTFDADGQHSANDIEKVIEPIIKKQADLVIGSRFLVRQAVPWDRYFLNWAANLTTFALFGTFSTDTQSGFRAMSKRAYNQVDFKNDRMEFSSEILIDAKKHKLKVVEVPINAIYTDYSRNKGQKNINAFAILSRFLIKLFR